MSWLPDPGVDSARLILYLSGCYHLSNIGIIWMYGGCANYTLSFSGRNDAEYGDDSWTEVRGGEPEGEFELRPSVSQGSCGSLGEAYWAGRHTSSQQLQ